MGNLSSSWHIGNVGQSFIGQKHVIPEINLKHMSKAVYLKVLLNALLENVFRKGYFTLILNIECLKCSF